MRRLFLSVLLAALLAPVLPAAAQAPVKVKVGQAVPTLGFLPLYAARATDAFAADKIEAEFASIPAAIRPRSPPSTPATSTSPRSAPRRR